MPDAVYSLSTTTGQQKGSYDSPESQPFPFPYYETFEQYNHPEQYGYLPRYTADISGAFEIAYRPDGQGKCMRQVVPVPTISWAPDWKPYTIIGDSAWTNYEVSADIYLNPGDAAGIMGRINDVGSGYGFIPKGYYLQLNDNGNCKLVVVRGKVDKKALVGDAEQQALIKNSKDIADEFVKKLQRMAVELEGSFEKVALIPGYTVDILKMVAKGQAKINSELQISETAQSFIDRMLNRIIIGMIIVAVIVGSSLIALVDIQPVVFNLPLFTTIGYVIAAALSFSLFRGKYK